MKKVFIGIAVVIVLGGAFYGLVLSRTKKETGKTSTVEETKPAINDEESYVAPEGWSVYESERFGYMISHPEEYQVEKNGDYSITLLKPNSQPSFGPANFVYVSVVLPDQLGNEGEIYNYNPSQFEKLRSISVGESISLADTESVDLSSWFTYTRDADTEIDGYPAQVYKNEKPWEFPGGTTEMRYVFETGDTIYILGYYYGGGSVESPINQNEAFEIISTFRLR